MQVCTLKTSCGIDDWTFELGDGHYVIVGKSKVYCGFDGWF